MRDALRRLHASQTFQHAERLLEFLDFVVAAKLEGRGADMKESVIGNGLYHREAAYDTKVDSIVRTQARRVRERLAEYYRSEGAADPFVLSLPKGGYVPQVEARVGAVETASPEPASAAKSRIGRPSHAMWLIAAGLSAASLLLAVSYWHLHRARPLTGTDVIVLADFANSTSDPIFDDTLKQGLSARLDQSPYLRILTARRVQDTLRLMGKAPAETLDKKLALEVCQRTGSQAVISGSIAPLIDRYVLSLEATECASGDTLVSEQSEAQSKSDVLAALGRAANSVREKLGESLSTIQKYNTPIEEATTPSLEALKAYSLGMKTSQLQGPAAAIPFYGQAIDLDPNFAMAYNGLGVAYGNVRQESQAAEYLRKAYDLRARVSERERLWITANYYRLCTGELEKTIQTYEQWIQTYPSDPIPRNTVAVIHGYLGRYERSVENLLACLRIDPGYASAWVNLVTAYCQLNQFDKALSAYRDALAQKVENPGLHVNLYGVAFLQNDTVEMQRQAAWCAGKPQVEGTMLGQQSATEAYAGRLGKARELLRRAIDSEVRRGDNDSAAQRMCYSALREVEFGNVAEGRKEAVSALNLSPTGSVQVLAALAFARAGELARAQALADTVSKHYPLNTVIQEYWLPTVRGAIESGRRNPHRAIGLLQAAEPIELGIPEPQIEEGATLYPAYVRGLAYLQLKDGKAAAAEFEKFKRYRGVVINCPLGALACLGLARAYALEGDTIRARTTYQEFVTLWKDADTDIPILQKAKAEYARF